jgi:uncharacterized protein (UPF0332 family)
MTDAEKLRGLTEQWLSRARETAAAAERLVEGGFYRDSIGRSYYAMFYAVSALLELRGAGTSKHRGALSFFDREFVRTGIFPKQMSAWLHSALDARQLADYNPQAVVTAELGRTMLERASSFLDAVESALPGLLSDVDSARL